jgi:hypothetical protein
MAPRTFTIGLVAALAIAPAHSGETDMWDVRKDKNGIKVLARDVSGSKFPAYKATMTMDGPMLPFINMFLDVPTYKDWMHGTTKSELKQSIGPGENIIYMVSGNPFPVADRDYCAHTTLTQSDDRKVTMQWVLHDCAVSKDAVRVKKMAVSMELIPDAAKKQFDVVLEGHVEPGGSIPSWLVDMFVTDVPYNTFKNARELSKDKKYSAPLDVIRDYL